jgi:PIN domain nuclease of toxin-antitoxin system
LRYLLDSHLLLWIAEESERLSHRAIEIISDEANELVFSAASLWEIAIKASRRRQDFIVDPVELRADLLANNFAELPVGGAHAVAFYAIPPKHGDPFDRLLLAQAIHERMTLVTTDKLLARYGDPVLKV